MTTLAFIDIETTGLDPTQHEIWEVAYILENNGFVLTREHFFLPVTLENASTAALAVGKFHTRYNVRYTNPIRTIDARAKLLKDLYAAVLVGNNVAFDAAFLRAFLGSAPWYYHIVDVKAMVGGSLGLAPPWDTANLLLRAGLPPIKRHLAQDDCQKAKDLYEFALRAGNAS